ncbi:MAG: hypothetical protein Q7I97_06090 [Thermovirgaceae bacterium]|nr:hypothetical protein [Thermovirgaceae bacterium]
MFEEPTVFLTVSVIVTFVFSIISTGYIARGDVSKHYDLLAYYRLFYVIFPLAAGFVGGFRYGIFSFLILFISPFIVASIYYYIKPTRQ